MPLLYPYVPKNIVVHLGAPQSNAQNVTVTFPDYIKNVASSEIYPTWDEAAIYANIYAQITFALNRIYTEFYSAQGYNFNITNNTAYDQSYTYGRNIFDNIDRIVDDIFNNYIRRAGTIEPIAAKYCNGTTVTCEGLSQWGSQYLARQGYSSVDILKNYYGDNIELVLDSPIRDIIQSYPGYPVSYGDVGEDVLIVQGSLNRISTNYPSIPKIPEQDGIFGSATEDAVKKFQSIFNLTPDGIVGKSTWYKMVYLYTGILRLSELDSEGHRIYAKSLEYPDAISPGDTGEKVRTLQYLLDVVSLFYPDIPSVTQDGIYGNETKNAVVAFQQSEGLTPDGIVGEETWDRLYSVYKGAVDSTTSESDNFEPILYPYPGRELKLNSRGHDVRLLQVYINRLAREYDEINLIPITGVFSPVTQNAVKQVQTLLGLTADGIVGEKTWTAIIDRLRLLSDSKNTLAMQHPGGVISQGADAEGA